MIQLRYVIEMTRKQAVIVLDEVVAENCSVHLEDLGGSWMLAVRDGNSFALLDIPQASWRVSRATVVEREGVELTLDGEPWDGKVKP